MEVKKYLNFFKGSASVNQIYKFTKLQNSFTQNEVLLALLNIFMWYQCISYFATLSKKYYFCMIYAYVLAFTCSKLTIETLEQGVKYGVFIVNYENISHLVLVFLLLTLNM